MNVKYLDTLVGRPPRHQQLYDLILRLYSMNLIDGDVIEEYPYHIYVCALVDTDDFKGIVTKNEFCYIVNHAETKVKAHIFQKNVSSNISRDGHGFDDLYDKCNMILRTGGVREPWTVE